METSIKDRAKIAKHAYFGVYYSWGQIKRRPVSIGYVDNIDLENTARRSSFLFNGRSAARDLVDSTWSDRITNKTLLGITQLLADRFGFKAVSQPTTSDPSVLVPEFSWENESPWTKLQQEAANQGILITSNQAGGLYVWKVSTSDNQWGFRLEEGRNVVGIKDNESGSNQFAKYVFRAPGTKGEELVEEASDSTCPNKRILTVNLPDRTMTKEQLKGRVATEMRRRAERKITATVGSWALDKEQLSKLGMADKKEIFWELNFLTPVKLPSLGINDRLLTSQIEYRADAKSVSCDIQLSKKEAFQ